MNTQYTNEELYKLSVESESKEDRDYYKNELIKQNIPLAKNLVKKYLLKVPILDPDEVYSVALMGLTLAYNYYEPNKNILFSTYAYFVIQREICHLINQYNHQKNKINNNVIYLDKNIKENSKTKIYELIPDPIDQYEEVTSKISINQILNLITDEINKSIFELHILYDKPFSEIGKMLNITKQGVFDRYKKQLNKLKILLQ